MLAMINELTDLPDWDHKMFDPAFTFEWKSAKLLTGSDITRAMADWVCVNEGEVLVVFLMSCSALKRLNTMSTTFSCHASFPR